MNITRLLPLLALSLAACQQADEPQQSEAGPDAKPGLTVADGTLFLPVVKGNPGAAYFTIVNTSAETTLATVQIEGAGTAELHETKGGSMQPLDLVQVPAGGTVKFERGGKHVMAFDIDESLKAGGTAEMTLTFSGGDKLSAPLTVKAVGAADADTHSGGDAH